VSVQVFGQQCVGYRELWVAASRPQALGMVPLRGKRWRRGCDCHPQTALEAATRMRDIFTHTVRPRFAADRAGKGASVPSRAPDAVAIVREPGESAAETFAAGLSLRGHEGGRNCALRDVMEPTPGTRTRERCRAAGRRRCSARRGRGNRHGRAQENGGGRKKFLKILLRNALELGRRLLLDNFLCPCRAVDGQPQG
jgi:hypothetical protein